MKTQSKEKKGFWTGLMQPYKMLQSSLESFRDEADPS